jgi:hypothetical protein
MSLTGAEKLIDTGCWRADAHGAVRSCRADTVDEFLSSTRVRTTRGAAIIPRCNQSVWAGRNPCV